MGTSALLGCQIFLSVAAFLPFTGLVVLRVVMQIIPSLVLFPGVFRGASTACWLVASVKMQEK